MKQFFCFSLLCALILSFCACEKLPNMNEILSYQTQNCVFDVAICDGNKQAATITLKENQIQITFEKNELLQGISFLSDEKDDLFLLYDSVKIPLPESELIKANQWASLFRLPSDALWKIEKDTLGGINVLICTENETHIKLYIDAATLLPLKIQSDEMEIDILNVQTS